MELRYFSHDGCSVCKDLKPKLRQSIQEHFPHVRWVEIDTQKTPEVAAASGVFTVPVATIHIDDREYRRFIRSFGVSEVLTQLERLQNLSE